MSNIVLSPTFNTFFYWSIVFIGLEIVACILIEWGFTSVQQHEHHTDGLTGLNPIPHHQIKWEKVAWNHAGSDAWNFTVILSPISIDCDIYLRFKTIDNSVDVWRLILQWARYFGLPHQDSTSAFISLLCPPPASLWRGLLFVSLAATCFSLSSTWELGTCLCSEV